MSLLCDLSLNVSLDLNKPAETEKSQTNSDTIKLMDWGSERPATPVFCEVRFPFLSVEFSGFDKSLTTKERNILNN